MLLAHQQAQRPCAINVAKRTLPERNYAKLCGEAVLVVCFFFYLVSMFFVSGEPQIQQKLRLEGI